MGGVEVRGLSVSFDMLFNANWMLSEGHLYAAAEQCEVWSQPSNSQPINAGCYHASYFQQLHTLPIKNKQTRTRAARVQHRGGIEGGRGRGEGGGGEGEIERGGECLAQRQPLHIAAKEGGDKAGERGGMLTTKAASTSAKAFFSLSGPITRLQFFKGMRSLHKAMAILISPLQVTASILRVPPSLPSSHVTNPCR